MKRVLVLFHRIGLSLFIILLNACESSSQPTPDLDLTATANGATQDYLCCPILPQLATVTPSPAQNGSELVLYRGNPQRTGVYDVPAVRDKPEVQWQAKSVRPGWCHPYWQTGFYV